MARGNLMDQYHKEQNNRENLNENILHIDDAMKWITKGDENEKNGDYEKALECYIEGKNIIEKTLGKEHPTHASSLSKIGKMYFEFKNYSKAETYYLEALSIDECVHGKEHPFYMKSLCNLGSVYHYLKDYTQAEKYYLEAKTIMEKTIGKEHKDYKILLDNLQLLFSEIYYSQTGNKEYYYKTCEIELIKKGLSEDEIMKTIEESKKLLGD